MTENLFIPTKITTELAEEIGWHIGDGSMNYYNNHGTLKGIYQLRGHIEDDREHYEKIIKPLFKLIYDLDISLRKMPSTRVYGFQIWSNKLIKFKKDLGLPLGKKLDMLSHLICFVHNVEADLSAKIYYSVPISVNMIKYLGVYCLL